ncbi:hypothetical protein KBD49_13840 [Myxococcota bacterium]|nr:hypothetical protein [Myxococcota bacterium]
MRRWLVWSLGVLFAPALVLAQPTVYYSDRPIVLPKGQREANLDVSVGLNRGYRGEDFGIAAGLANDRHPGLHFRAGVLKNFELGLSLAFEYSLHHGDAYRVRPPIPVATSHQGVFSAPEGTVQNRPPRLNPGPEGNGTRRIAGWPYRFGDEQAHLNPLYIYGRYAIVPQFGLELGLLVPIDSLQGNNRPTLRLGLPFQWILSRGLFSVHVQPDLLVGFAKKSTGFDMPQETVLVSYFVDAGFTLALAGAFLDVSLAWGQDAWPFHRGVLPMTFTMGYTILPEWDLALGVSLDNLIPKEGKADDARRLCLMNRIRF